MPRADVLRRFRRSWKNFQSLYRPLADAWMVYDNAGDKPTLIDRGPCARHAARAKRRACTVRPFTFGKMDASSRDGRKRTAAEGGEQLIFYKAKTRAIDGEITTASPLTNLWDDILSNNLHNEGGVSFPNGKKPEALIKRVLELTTQPDDIVLDSFAGSGTTGAVAQKMGRRWIMVELGEHCHTHIIPRLKRVVDGEDQSGITKAVSWRGGGGFRRCIWNTVR